MSTKNGIYTEKKEFSAMKLNSDKQKYAYVFPMF